MNLIFSTKFMFMKLWKIDYEINKLNLNIKFLLPNTIFYYFSSPHFWYYMNGNNIIKISNDHISNNKIIKYYSKYKQKEICCYFLTTKNENNLFQKKFYNHENLDYILYKNKKEYNCFIQEFIFPKSDNNHIIKIIWSKQFILIKKIINTNNLYNTKIPLEDRLNTIEKFKTYIKEESIKSPTLIKSLESYCDSIVHLINKTSNDNVKIIEVVFYLKLGKKEKFYLLFCNKLKMNNSNFSRTDVDINSPRFIINIIDSKLKFKKKFNLFEEEKNKKNEKNKCIVKNNNNCFFCLKFYKNLYFSKISNFIDHIKQLQLSQIHLLFSNINLELNMKKVNDLLSNQFSSILYIEISLCESCFFNKINLNEIKLKRSPYKHKINKYTEPYNKYKCFNNLNSLNPKIDFFPKINNSIGCNSIVIKSKKEIKKINIRNITQRIKVSHKSRKKTKKLLKKPKKKKSYIINPKVKYINLSFRKNQHYLLGKKNSNLSNLNKTLYNSGMQFFKNNQTINNLKEKWKNSFN